jgi:hypothetical protein
MSNMDLEAIKHMDRGELIRLETAIKARYARLRREDPMGYTVKRIRNGVTSYMTRCAQGGEHQFYALTLEHSYLRLFSARKDAQIMRDVCDTGRTCNTAQSEVLEIPKKDILTLPCYRYYCKFESFQLLT